MMTDSHNGIVYYQNFNKIADDINTQHLLKKHKVSSYFSGCLTLTLHHYNRDRKDEIIFVDLMCKKYTSSYKRAIVNKLILFDDMLFPLTPIQSNPQKIANKMKEFIQNFFSNT